MFSVSKSVRLHSIILTIPTNSTKDKSNRVEQQKQQQTAHKHTHILRDFLLSCMNSALARDYSLYVSLACQEVARNESQIKHWIACIYICNIPLSFPQIRRRRRWRRQRPQQPLLLRYYKPKCEWTENKTRTIATTIKRNEKSNPNEFHASKIDIR